VSFEVLVLSDPDYEELIAEVSIEGEFCCIISQDDGEDKMRLHIHPRQSGQPWDFSLIEFQDALEQAHQRLRGLPKR
jgi:hypothetical protein